MGRNHIDARLGAQCNYGILGPYRGSGPPFWGCILRPLFEGSEQPPGLAQPEQDEIGPLFGASGPEGLKKGLKIGLFWGLFRAYLGCLLEALLSGPGAPLGPSLLDRLQIRPLFGASGPGGLKKGPQIGPI